MKLHLLVFLFAVAGLAGGARAENYPFAESFSRTGAFAATGSLVLENVNGDVVVRTWAKNEILIEGEKRARTTEELAAVDLTIELSPDRATVKARLPKRSGWFGNTLRAAVRFSITLPAGATIEKLSTVNASVRIEGLQGDLHAETVNGGIQATGLGGDVHLETVNGGVHVECAALGSGQKLAASTVNGRIVIALPRNVGANVDASVVNGHIDCDFPLELNHGRVSSRHLHATIGQGGGSVAAETVNGGIQIKAL